ncbi:MAG: 5-formyltetrahydrofolate cyclo-ligase [Ginsengibacter sp.]
MTKQEIRNIYKEKRKQLSHHTTEKFNDLLLINFQKAKLPFINCVHTYLSSSKLGEADTAKIIRYLQFKNPELIVAVPKVDVHSGNMVQYYFDEDTVVVHNAFGIDEPVNGDLITEKEIDLVLVPLLAFDKMGYRVGYGKGHYDKFLSRCRPDVIKAGISFYDPVDEIEDINAFDIPLNFCVTPQELYVFDN